MSVPGDATKPPPSGNRLFYPERWPPVVLAAVLLSGAVFTVYHGTFSTPFLLHDQPGIVENRALGQFCAPAAAPDSEGTAPGAVLRWPIVNLSLALNFAACGLDVRGYHVVNVLLHVAAAVLLFAVLHRTFRLPALPEALRRAAFPSALVAALLWALHPLQTQAVIGILPRSELLIALFGLATLQCVLRAAEAAGLRQWWSWCATAACCLGMASGATALAIPVLVFLYDRTFLAGTFREAWRQRGRLHLALAATAMLALFFLARAEGDPGGTEGEAQLGLIAWCLARAQFVARYARLALWPDPLVFDYGGVVVRRLSEVWPSLLFVALAAGLTLYLLVRRPRLGFGGAWFFVALVPGFVAGGPHLTPPTEPHMYLPLAGCVALAVAAMVAAGGRRVLVAAVALLVLSSGAALRRNQDYASALTLWGDTVSKAPANARARLHLANALLAAGRVDDALRQYEAALRLEPHFAAARLNLAGALLQDGRAAAALPLYEEALHRQPESLAAAAGRAATLVQLGRKDEAVAAFDYAASLGLLPADEHLRFGRALAEVGRLEEALQPLQEALRLNPDSAEVRIVLGMVLSASDRGAEALPHFYEAVRLRPDDAQAHGALGDALFESFRPAEALPHYETALRLQPARAAIWHASIGDALSLLGRARDAITHYEAALAINPDDAGARASLARIRAAVERRGRVPP